MYEDQALFAKAYLATNVYFASRVWLDYRIHAASCVERVTRSGGYRGVRRYFLDWFAGYIGPRPVPGKEAIARELRRARRGVAHPNAARIRRSVGRVARFAASWRRRAR